MTRADLHGPKYLSRRAHSPVGLVVLALVISTYLVVNAGEIRVTLPVRIAYAATFFVAMVLAGVSPAGRSQARQLVPVPLAVWSGVMTLALLAAPVALHASMLTSVTDYLIAILPAVFFIALRQRDMSENRSVSLIAAATIAAFLGSTYAWATATPGERYESPAIVAIVGAWAFTTLPLSHAFPARIRPRVRIVALCAVLVLAPVVIGSQSRTAMVIWPAAGMFFLLLPGMTRTPRAVKIAILAAIAGFTLIYLGGDGVRRLFAPDVLRQLRLDALFTSQEDMSVGARVAEVRDVLRTMRLEGDFLTQLFGFGHGSTYAPMDSYIADNVDPDTGRVHNIHATPVMVWFRYGWVGLASWLALIAGVAVAAVRNFSSSRSFANATLLVMFAMYLIDLLVRNSMADPVFAITVALISLHTSVRREPVA